jgi:hypothetical protein
VDNSSGSFDDKVIINTATANDMLHANSISSIGVGSWMMSVARIVTNPNAMMVLL